MVVFDDLASGAIHRDGLYLWGPHTCRMSSLEISEAQQSIGVIHSACRSSRERDPQQIHGDQRRRQQPYFCPFLKMLTRWRFDAGQIKIYNKDLYKTYSKKCQQIGVISCYQSRHFVLVVVDSHMHWIQLYLNYLA